MHFIDLDGRFVGRRRRVANWLQMKTNVGRSAHKRFTRTPLSPQCTPSFSTWDSCVRRRASRGLTAAGGKFVKGHRRSSGGGLGKKGLEREENLFEHAQGWRRADGGRAGAVQLAGVCPR